MQSSAGGETTRIARYIVAGRCARTVVGAATRVIIVGVFH
jgi:hypothetical protein